MRCHRARRAEAIEDETLLGQGKNAIVYGAGGSIGGMAARTLTQGRATA
jgi:FlaA1/EpsC-like NDP-sugar epimerase